MWALTVACGAMFYKNLRFYPPVSIVKAVSSLELLLYSEQEINLSLFSPFPGTQIMSRTGLENRVLADTLRVRLTVTGIICFKESQHLIFTIIAINGTAMHIDKLLSYLSVWHSPYCNKYQSHCTLSAKGPF